MLYASPPQPLLGPSAHPQRPVSPSDSHTYTKVDANSVLEFTYLFWDVADCLARRRPPCHILLRRSRARVGMIENIAMSGRTTLLRIDDTSSRLVYDGPWAPGTVNGTGGDAVTIHTSTSAGSTAKFAFNGASVVRLLLPERNSRFA